MAMAVNVACADEPPARVWILPFDNPQADVSLGYLEEAIPALLAVALSQSDWHAVVDRQHVNQVLAELSLTLEGLTARKGSPEVGRLLGATIMVSGSVAREGPNLLLAMRAVDLETGIVTATADARGPYIQLGRLVGDVHRRISRDLGRRLPDLAGHQIDHAPVSNLHFMRGLGYYYSARYNQAVAEFMHAAEEPRSSDLSRLWLANAYLAQEQYAHACLELSRLRPDTARKVGFADLAAKMAACERQLSAEEAAIIRRLAALSASGKE
jgi:TolB-like protein